MILWCFLCYSWHVSNFKRIRIVFLFHKFCLFYNGKIMPKTNNTTTYIHRKLNDLGLVLGIYGIQYLSPFCIHTKTHISVSTPNELRGISWAYDMQISGEKKSKTSWAVCMYVRCIWWYVCEMMRQREVKEFVYT